MSEETMGFWAGALIIVIIVMGVKIHYLSSDNQKLKDYSSEQSDDIDSANDTIDGLNSQIEDAQGEAWTDYDNMGITLEGLAEDDESYGVVAPELHYK